MTTKKENHNHSLEFNLIHQQTYKKKQTVLDMKMANPNYNRLVIQNNRIVQVFYRKFLLSTYDQLRNSVG